MIAMLRVFARFLVYLALGCFWAHSAAAEMLISPNEIDSVVILAKVRLVSRTPVSTQPYNVVTPYPIIGVVKDEPICGYMYHAKVLEAFKGEQTEFDFFSSEDTDFSGFDHDYLVAVYKRWDGRTFLDAADLRLTLPLGEVRRINCLIAEKYYVARLTQSMYSFDNAAASAFGGEWLAPGNRQGFPCCAFIGPDTNLVESGPDTYGMKSWLALKPLVQSYAKPSELPPEGYYPVSSWSKLREKLIKMSQE